MVSTLMRSRSLFTRYFRSIIWQKIKHGENKYYSTQAKNIFTVYNSNEILKERGKYGKTARNPQRMMVPQMWCLVRISGLSIKRKVHGKI